MNLKAKVWINAHMNDLMNFLLLGIIIGEGAHWEQQRRFTLRTLRYAVNVQFIATAGSCFLPQDRLSL